MPKYYETLTQETNLNHKRGSALVVSPDFQVLSSIILSQCIFMQNLIQEIIFISHDKELIGAKKTLKKFPNPKSRVDFLCSFNYVHDDPVIIKVFNFARGLFSEIYELRNVMSHEVWSSSESYPDLVLFSSLDENARLQMASGLLLHVDETTSKEIYAAIIRFIRSTKIISHNNLITAKNDLDLCNICLMGIMNVLKETDPARKEEARKSFFVYQGTSHLFEDSLRSSIPSEFFASKTKTINQ